MNPYLDIEETPHGHRWVFRLPDGTIVKRGWRKRRERAAEAAADWLDEQ